MYRQYAEGACSLFIANEYDDNKFVCAQDSNDTHRHFSNSWHIAHKTKVTRIIYKQHSKFLKHSNDQAIESKIISFVLFEIQRKQQAQTSTAK